MDEVPKPTSLDVHAVAKTIGLERLIIIIEVECWLIVKIGVQKSKRLRGDWYTRHREEFALIERRSGRDLGEG